MRCSQLSCRPACVPTDATPHPRRSKKETQRLHDLAKSKDPLPRVKRAKREEELERSPTPSTVSSFTDDEDFGSDSEAGDEDLEGVDVEGYGSDDTGDDSDSDDADPVDESDASDSDDDAAAANERQRARKKSRLGASGAEADNLEASYENKATAARLARAKAEPAVSHAEVDHLPIKLADGTVQRRSGTTTIALPPSAPRAPSPAAAIKREDDASGSDSDDVSETDEVERLAQQRGRFGRMSVLDVIYWEDPELRGVRGKGVAQARVQRRLAVAKEQIARTGAEIMAGGELIDNVSGLGHNRRTHELIKGSCSRSPSSPGCRRLRSRACEATLTSPGKSTSPSRSGHSPSCPSWRCTRT